MESQWIDTEEQAEEVAKREFQRGTTRGTMALATGKAFARVVGQRLYAPYPGDQKSTLGGGIYVLQVVVVELDVDLGWQVNTTIAKVSFNGGIANNNAWGTMRFKFERDALEVAELLVSKQWDSSMVGRIEEKESERIS